MKPNDPRSARLFLFALGVSVAVGLLGCPHEAATPPSTLSPVPPRVDAQACEQTSPDPDVHLGSMAIPGLRGIEALAIGGTTTWAIDASGALLRWGVATQRPKGHHVFSAVPAVVIAGDVAAISASGDGACARMSDGALRCFGADLAAADDENEMPLDFTREIELPANLRVVDVIGGGLRGCARLVGPAGDVICFDEATGSKSFLSPPRALPAGPLVGVSSMMIDVLWGFTPGSTAWAADLSTMIGAPRPYKGLDQLVAFDAAFDCACGSTAGGRVRCTGDMTAGVLGKNPPAGPIDQWVQADIEGVPPAVEIVIGDGFACARHADGTATCWGNNGDGEAGGCSTSTLARPTRVRGLSGAKHLAAGPSHACAVVDDGAVRCWGKNIAGAFGVPPAKAP